MCLNIKGSPNSASPPAPLLVGISRKSMLSRITGLDDVSDRYWPTVALNTQSLRMIEAITASANKSRHRKPKAQPQTSPLGIQERLGSGDGERKTLLTRQIAFEPLPASVLFGLGWRWGFH